MNYLCLQLLVFFSLITSAFARLDDLVAASGNFSIAIQQQLLAIKDHSPTEFAERTISYAAAKTAYCTALRDAMPELINIATGKEVQPSALDAMTEIFSVAGEEQAEVADKETADLLQLLSSIPDIQRATLEFENAQKAEEAFQRDFGARLYVAKIGIPVRVLKPVSALRWMTGTCEKSCESLRTFVGI
jgi:hypothetical protein